MQGKWSFWASASPSEKWGHSRLPPGRWWVNVKVSAHCLAPREPWTDGGSCCANDKNRPWLLWQLGKAVPSAVKDKGVREGSPAVLTVDPGRASRRQQVQVGWGTPGMGNCNLLSFYVSRKVVNPTQWIRCCFFLVLIPQQEPRTWNQKVQVWRAASQLKIATPMRTHHPSPLSLSSSHSQKVGASCPHSSVSQSLFIKHLQTTLPSAGDTIMHQGQACLWGMVQLSARARGVNGQLEYSVQSAVIGVSANIKWNTLYEVALKSGKPYQYIL